MADDAPDRDDGTTARVTRGSKNTYKPRHIPARILWPALGFPAVISPGDSSKSDNATNSVSVVLVSTRPTITPKQAADHLRFVPWNQRRTRFLPTGTANGFTEDEIEVRSSPDSWETSLKKPGIVTPFADEFALQLYFGYDASRENGFHAGVSRRVLKLYSEWGYPYLHEVRVSRAASSRIGPGQYNLFWISANPNDTDAQISDEMALLIREHATPTRKALKTSMPLSFLLEEYEYDYDARHGPVERGLSHDRRTEVLHPLFVQPAIPHLQIAHITDLHVDVRTDVYEDNLSRAGDIHVDLDGDDYTIHKGAFDFNNWNKSVTKLYQLGQASDILLLTGDLVDYGRGHLGLDAPEQLGNDAMYHVDRNFMYFYYILAAGSSYTKPAYTILGNHDWRINPYTPFAVAGAPDPRSFVNNYLKFKPPLEQDETGMAEDAEEKSEKKLDKILNAILRKAHGAGYEKAFNYLKDADGVLSLTLEDPGLSVGQFWNLIKQTQTMNIPQFPTETRVESVLWYLLLINPFLDYSFQLPGGYDLLMLDWGEYEDVLFPIVALGQEWFYLPWQAAEAANSGPKARSCLTILQKKMVEDFVAKSGKAKVLGIHAPPVGPYPTWVNDELYSSTREHPKHDRTSHYQVAATSREFDVFYAIKPPDAPYGFAADYGSISQNREWLIKELRNDDARIRLVLSGHIHRNGLFVVELRQGDPQHNVLAGKMLIKMITPSTAAGANPPSVSHSSGGEHGPLYVNTTSAGPRGHSYVAENHKPGTRVSYYVDSGYSVIVLSADGTVRKVEFRNTKDAVISASAVGS